jgi:hypothetical protein
MSPEQADNPYQSAPDNAAQPQPATPENVPSTSDVPVYAPDAVVQSPVYSPGHSFVYSSNPFIATSHGLGKALTVNPLSSLSVGLIGILIFLIAGILGLIITAAMHSSVVGVIVIIFIMIAMLLVLARTSAAITVVNLESYKDNAVTGRQAMGPLSSHRFVPFILANILTGLLEIVGFVLLIIPGMIISARLSLVPFVVYDEHLSAGAAIKRSWQLTKGHAIEMMGAFVASTLVVGGSGGLLSLVGSQSAYINRYTELKAAEKQGLSTGKMHWMNPLLLILGVVGIALYIGLFALSMNQAKSLDPNLTLPTSSSNSRSYCYYESNTTMTTTCVDRKACTANLQCSEINLLSTQGNNSTTTSDPLYQ